MAMIGTGLSWAAVPFCWGHNMCGSKGTTSTVYHPTDRTVETAKPQFADGQDRARKLYRLQNPNQTIEGDLSGSRGVQLGGQS